MDGAVNPYLLQAGIIAAGIDGMKYNRKPGKPVHVNMYEESHKVKNAKKLPKTLDSALSNLTNSKIVLLGGINFKTLKRTKMFKPNGVAAISWIKKNGPSINTGPF